MTKSQFQYLSKKYRQPLKTKISRKAIVCWIKSNKNILEIDFHFTLIHSDWWYSRGCIYDTNDEKFQLIYESSAKHNYAQNATALL